MLNQLNRPLFADTPLPDHHSSCTLIPPFRQAVYRGEHLALGPPRWRPGWNTASAGIFPGSSHTSDLEIDTPVATLPGAWRYKVSAGTGWPGVSTLWLGEMESLICNFCLSVAAWKVWSAASISVWQHVKLSRSVPEIHSHVAGTLSNQHLALGTAGNGILLSGRLFGRVVEASGLRVEGRGSTQGRAILATSLNSDGNRKISVMIGTFLYVFGSRTRHSELTEEM